VDDYRETLGGFFFDEDVLTLDPDAPLEDVIDGEADFVSAEPFPEDVITTRRFNGQTIESIPLTVGALISLPVPPPSGGIDLSGARFGLSYTHDFDDQERAVIGVPIGANRIPSFALRAEEQNRNQDFITISASVDIDIFGFATASLGYERDQGFDERTSADSVRLLFRVPLGLSGS
jgi:hypothetical protein